MALTMAHAELAGSLAGALPSEPPCCRGLSMRPTQPERTTSGPQKARGLVMGMKEEEAEAAEEEERRRVSPAAESDAAAASPLLPLLLP